MIKIAITGPKNSGKSVIAGHISAKLGEPFAEDFSEQYMKQKGRVFVYEDLDEIAHGQKMLIEFLNPKKFLIAETEMLALKVWAETKFKKCSAYVIEEWHKQEFDLYIVCWPKAKYQEDYNAEEFAKTIIEELEIRDANYVVLKGTSAERRATALQTIIDFQNSISHK